jgi:hypothetical protein
MRQNDPLLHEILVLQAQDGSWKPGSLAGGRLGSSSTLATAYALTRLAYRGFTRDTIEKQSPVHDAIERGVSYLLAQQRPDGSWDIPAGEMEDDEPDAEGYHTYSMIPLQTALPLRGLAACGYASEACAEQAYTWLLAQRLPEGAWPTGMAAGVHGYVAGYRRLPHSRWGCRSNTTAALTCLALHPQRRNAPDARRALDHLLGRETRERQAFGFEVARLVGAEPARGYFTYFARFDLALLLDLCCRIGASRQDARVAALVEASLAWQGPYGIWEYAARPQVSRWLTFDLLRSLSGLSDNLDWVNLEPRTPFRPYPSRKKRY